MQRVKGEEESGKQENKERQNHKLSFCIIL
jgi:hypothetical protein